MEASLKDSEKETSSIGEVCVIVVPKRGVEGTVLLETSVGFVKSVGDSLWESGVFSRGELLSLNNNPLLLLRSNFAPSADGTGRCRAGSFTAMLLMP